MITVPNHQPLLRSFSSARAADNWTPGGRRESTERVIKAEEIASKELPTQFHQRPDFLWISIGGTLLAINAGFINALSLLTFLKTTITHVTGNITKAAIAGTELSTLSTCSQLMMILLSFMVGAFLTGLVIGNETFQLGRGYGQVLVVISLVLTAASIDGTMTSSSTLTVYLLGIASGLQNGLTTRYSGAVVRTTHMTGIATDISLVVGRFVRNRQDKSELWKLKILVPLICGFFAGGILGELSFRLIGNYSLFFCAGFTFSLALLYVGSLSVIYNQSFLEILMNPSFGESDEFQKLHRLSSSYKAISARLPIRPDDEVSEAMTVREIDIVQNPSAEDTEDDEPLMPLRRVGNSIRIQRHER